MNPLPNYARRQQYSSRTVEEAIAWQQETRTALEKVLLIDDLIESTHAGEIDLNPVIISTEEKENYHFQEIEINSTQTRRIKIVLTIPKTINSACPAVVCLTGHGGDR